jgi:hypothetical protein
LVPIVVVFTGLRQAAIERGGVLAARDFRRRVPVS